MLARLNQHHTTGDTISETQLRNPDIQKSRMRNKRSPNTYKFQRPRFLHAIIHQFIEQLSHGFTGAMTVPNRMELAYTALKSITCHETSSNTSEDHTRSIERAV